MLNGNATSRLVQAMAVQSSDDGTWICADVIADAWEDADLGAEVLVRMWRDEADRRIGRA